MKPDAAGLCLIEEVACNGFVDMRTQFVPSIPLRKDVVSQALSDETTIGFLRNTEDNLHTNILSFLAGWSKPGANSSELSRPPVQGGAE